MSTKLTDHTGGINFFVYTKGGKTGKQRRQAFLIKCLENNTSMAEVLNRAINAYLYKKPKRKVKS